MNDVYHYFGSDIGQSATGDLQGIDGTTRGQQRVLRRLLTNPGDYIFQPNYGAGLPRMVGELAEPAKIKALILGQMLLEDAVARTPEPQVDVQPILGGVSCRIKYTDAVSKTPAVLSFNVSK